MTTEDIILKTLNTLHDEGDVLEIRIIEDNGKNKAGYYDYNHFDKLAEDAHKFDGLPGIPGIYITVNPVQSILLARSHNKIKRAKETTTDSQIKYRKYLPFDIDPERPAGVSSTDEMHDKSIEKAEEVKQWLKEKGFPDPIIADSGNGAHLLYRIDEPNTPEAKELIEGVQKAVINALNQPDKDGIDIQGFANASRLWKLYGTVAKKGDEIPGAGIIHRRSKMLNVPDDIQVVTTEQLQAVAALYQPEPKAQPPQSNQSNNSNKFDIEGWMDTHNINVVRTKKKRGKIIYVLETCPINPEHTGNKEAVIIQDDDGKLGFKCHHNSCSDKHWSDVREKYEPGYKDKKKDSAATSLIDYVKDDRVILFHDDKQNPYSRVPLNGKEVTLSVKDRAFKRWITQRYYESTGTAPGSEAISSALNVIEAMACFDGEERELYNRICWHDGAIWYDIGNWEAVKITGESYEIVENPPILFRTYKHQKPLGTPHLSQTNNIIRVLEFVNIKDHNHMLLFLVLLVSYFIPDIPHPVLTLHGEKGAAKTTTFKIVKALVDPSTLQILTFPRDNTELIQKLSHHYYAPFDNVTKLSEWQSDALCRAVTGEGFSKRELYSDDEDVIYTFQRGIGLNGINVVATKPDLLDRSILIGLDRIPKNERKTEGELWQAFNIHKPEIIGSIFTTLSKAMAIQPTIKLYELPRMADFTIWGCAIAEAMGYDKKVFLDAYYSNIQAQNREALEGSPIGELILFFMEGRTEPWTGKPSELLNALEKIAEAQNINISRKAFPKAANVLTRRINEIKTNLLDEGVIFSTGRDEKGQRYLTLGLTDNTVNTVKPSKQQSNGLKKLDDTFDDKNTVKDIVNEKTHACGTLDGIDDIDDTLHTFTGQCDKCGQSYPANDLERGPAGLDKICHTCQAELKELHAQRIATPGPGDNGTMLIRALKDIPTFAGHDGKTYSLNAQDVGSIPKVNAAALIKRNIAIEVTAAPL